MLEAPIPENDQDRIAALRALSILDTPAEDRFDSITRLATKLFNVPIAYISLVDENRQWFKSKCGISTTQTGRDISFCGHVVAEGKLLYIPDATVDDRFRDNPLVTDEPHIRFYVGCPLTGPEGHNVGTLCIVDQKPRELDGEQFDVLKELTDMAQVQLNMLDVIVLQNDLLQVKHELAEKQKQLTEDLNDAAQFVASTLPEKLNDQIVTDWQFIPSAQLGGDAFGYHWIDDDHLAIYLLDVSGHGVGASLLSVSAITTLRTKTLPDVDFTRPGQVLAALNDVYEQDCSSDNHFFTMWYGVYNKATRKLVYANGGHPAPILFEQTGSTTTTHELRASGFLLGQMPDMHYQERTHHIESLSHLFVFSDGIYEVTSPEGTMMSYKDFKMQLSIAFEESQSQNRTALESLLDRQRTYQATDTFEDDITLLEVIFE